MNPLRGISMHRRSSQTLRLVFERSQSTEIHFGATREILPGLLKDRRVFVITDENVHRIYAAEMPPERLIVIPAGEISKSFMNVNYIVEKLLILGCDRKSIILGFGGGVVSDLTGFVASIFMRGVEFGFVCTTLLSQADAGIGGKNGINHAAWKNVIGTINQPSFIVIDPQYLQTLALEDYYSGLAEVIKHALIRSPQMLQALEANLDGIRAREEEVLAALVAQSIQIKAEIVQADPQEQNLRKILNFGHTFGHVLEMQHRIPHGYAIADGIRIAAWISYKEGFIELEAVNRIQGLLAELAYPIYPRMIESELLSALGKDKKKEANRIDYILLKDLGNAIYQSFTPNELLGHYDALPQFS